jgi:hypothetical protein
VVGAGYRREEITMTTVSLDRLALYAANDAAQAIADAYCVEVDARLEWRAALAAERVARGGR